MTTITIRTGTYQPEKLDRPDIDNKTNLELPASQLDKNISELETSSDFAPSKIKTLCESFQSRLTDKAPTVDYKIVEQNHNPEITDDVSDDLTLLARFVPKEDMPAKDTIPSQTNSNDTFEEGEKNNSETQNRQAKSNFSDTNSSLKVLDDKNITKTSTEAVLNESNKNKDGKSEITTDSETNSDEVTTVLGSGCSPENDPDHSMLKFAVFEVQDLSEEFKRLRDILDDMTDSRSLDITASKEDETLDLEPATDFEFLDLAVDQPDKLFDVLNGKLSDMIEHQELTVAKNTPILEMMSNGCSTFSAADSKTRSEISCCSASFKSCDMNGFSEEIRSFQSFSQEIITVVK